ncbi:hypothetical protein OTK49_21135 [Vibrio coralliirubri]|uniref:hypothetical protein n=1 Tax=Vibrio coralliirubri TaxID=1516159 RepID=UPI0022848FB3|nr:hypothetical protein [Vibrio coralliirubri]MCY9865025.1 hypothetical protein [Vibrio coralliirubri]
MYHHLKHALSRSSKRINDDLNLDSWFAISNRVTKAINDPSLMVNWRAVFDYVAQYGIESNNIHLGKHLTSIGRTDTSLLRSCHDYATTCKNGQPCWVDGMCAGTRHLIPDFTDNIPLGSVLAGIDQTSTLAAWNHLNDYKAYIGKEFAKTLSWFKDSVLTPYQEIAADTAEVAYRNRSLVESLTEFTNITRTAFGDRKCEWNKKPLPQLIFPDLQFVTLSVHNLLAINLDSGESTFGASEEFLALVDSIDTAITVLSTLDPQNQEGF